MGEVPALELLMARLAMNSNETSVPPSIRVNTVELQSTAGIWPIPLLCEWFTTNLPGHYQPDMHIFRASQGSDSCTQGR